MVGGSWPRCSSGGPESRFRSVSRVPYHSLRKAGIELPLPCPPLLLIYPVLTSRQRRLSLASTSADKMTARLATWSATPLLTDSGRSPDLRPAADQRIATGWTESDVRP